MNASVASLVPAPVAVVAAPIEATEPVEHYHEKMLLNGRALFDALLEEPTEEVLNSVGELVKLIGLDLAYCRQAIRKEGTTGT